MLNPDRLLVLFRDELNLDVESVDVDLIADGLLDSLTFVDLLMLIETQTGAQVPVEEIEFDQFNSIRNIYEFLRARNLGVPPAAPEESPDDSKFERPAEVQLPNVL